MSPKTPKMPGGGGSYVRQSDGSLELAETPKPANSSKSTPAKPAESPKTVSEKEA